MEAPEILKLLGIILSFIIVIVGTAKVLKIYSTFGDPVLKKITNLVVVISAVPCVLRLIALSVSQIDGEWFLGKINWNDCLDKTGGLFSYYSNKFFPEWYFQKYYFILIIIHVNE